MPRQPSKTKGAAAPAGQAPGDDPPNATLAILNALIDRGYGNLKHATEGDDGAHGITVRFVAPTDKP